MCMYVCMYICIQHRKTPSTATCVKRTWTPPPSIADTATSASRASTTTGIYIHTYVCMYVCMYTQCSKDLLCCDALQQVVEHLYRQRELRLLPGCGVLGVHTHLRGHRPLPRAHGNRYIYIIHTYITYKVYVLMSRLSASRIRTNSYTLTTKTLMKTTQTFPCWLCRFHTYIHTYIHYIILTKLHAYILTCCTNCLYRLRVLELLQLLYLCIHTLLHTYIHTYIHI